MCQLVTRVFFIHQFRSIWSFFRFSNSGLCSNTWNYYYSAVISSHNPHTFYHSTTSNPCIHFLLLFLPEIESEFIGEPPYTPVSHTHGIPGKISTRAVLGRFLFTRTDQPRPFPSFLIKII